MSGAGIGKVNAVEHNECLIEGTSPYRDVGLNSFAPSFPYIDRGAEPQGRLDGLQRGNRRICSVENGNRQHRCAGRGENVPRYRYFADVDFFDRIGLKRLCENVFGCREQENRHRAGENPDSNLLMQAGEDARIFTAPSSPPFAR